MAKPPSEHNRPVFHDPSGKRAKQAGIAGGLLLSFLALIVAGFFATIALAPKLPTLNIRDPRILTALHQENLKHLKGKPAWTKLPKPRGHGASQTAKPLTVGFYVSWDPASRDSLSKHVKTLDIFAPQWIALRNTDGDVDITSDPQADVLVASAPHPPSVLPLIHNAHNDLFDGPLGNGFLLNPKAQDKLIQTLLDLANKKGYAGYVFDLENLSPEALAAYPAFIAKANQAFNPSGREIWVTAPFDDDAWPLKKLQDASDTLVLMAYDEHWATGKPGPAAGEDWFEKFLADRLAKLDPAHTIIALGSYGYDWTLGKHPGSTAVTFHEAIQTARDSDGEILMDDDALNPHFGYQDENGVDHSVWFLDATTAFNQIKVADAYKTRGYALWRMGSEDPGVWSVFGAPYGQVSAAGLTVLHAGSDVDFNGTGEIMKVVATPTLGKRSLTFDPDTGLIADQRYDQLPTAYVVDRYGAHPGWVALTFDDGPDGRWTPPILKILKEKNAPATFFMIGKNMQARPDLVRQAFDDGMLIGNHTYTHPNIAALPVAEVDIELNATQRLFESITGKSMRFLRPPYLGDASPSTPQEVAPLVNAQKLGYLTVGLRIDTDDWQKPSADVIVQRVLDGLANTDPETGGQVVLLHDSGGNRAETVKALPTLIDQLRAHGYTIVSVSQLAGMTAAQGQPDTNRPWLELTLDRMGFGIFRGIDIFLNTLFITAIALGVLRLIFLAILALVHRARQPGRTPPDLDPATGPLVSVLVPCFNEEKVIASSVRRILESNWTRIEVIVLDDGSTDGTSAEVERHFADEPRVRLMRLTNGGKATALNHGLEIAQGEIVVALDADTLFPPDTIGALVRWFADPKLGAVAGNALVGNRINVVTRWQALEYVSAQNLERRALAALGAVTVVPGAVGAWRKQAILDLGGYPVDTLAEDQDLTMAIQQAGWKVGFDPDARAYTEAPDSIQGLLKQRFRWSFGTLQCLWKHRSALFDVKHPVLGFIALPQIWLFQIILATAAPLVDLAVVWSLVTALADHLFHPVEAGADKLMQALTYWAVFIFVDLSAAALGMALERRAPWKDIVWIPVQRFGYRQLMYYVVVKAVVTAVRGPQVGWGRLERRGTASLGTGGKAQKS